MGFKLLHAHGQAGPRGKRSYLQFGTFSSRRAAKIAGKKSNLDTYKVVPISRVKKTKYKLLYYIR